MNKDEFQQMYHAYQTSDEIEAQLEAVKVNKMLTDGSRVVAKEFKPFGWCLMLDTAALLFDLMEIFDG
jgi:hypothetical protein